MGEPIMQNGWIIWSLLLYFKNFKDPNSASLIRFKCILHDAAVLFSVFQNFLKFKRDYLSSWGRGGEGKGNQFCRTIELFGADFFTSFISFLGILMTRIMRHSLHFNAFYIIQQSLSASLIRFQCILHDVAVLF